MKKSTSMSDSQKESEESERETDFVSESSEYTAYCLYCGYQVEKSTIFCPNCGRRIDN